MKRKLLFRGISVALALAILTIPVTGCGKKGGGTGSSPEFVYVPEYTQLPEQISDMRNMTIVGDTIYFTSNVAVREDGTVVTREELDEIYSRNYTVMEGASSTDVTVDEVPTEMPVINYETRLYSVKTDGTGYTGLEDYVAPEKPEGDYSYAGLNRLMADDSGNIWVWEHVDQTIFDLPDNFNRETGDLWEYQTGEKRENIFRKLSPTGAELAKLSFSSDSDSETEEPIYINDILLSPDGGIILVDGNGKINIVDANGQVSFELEFDGWTNSIFQLKDGRIAVSGGDNNGNNVAKVIDFDKKDWGENIEIPMHAYRFFKSTDKYDFIYSNDDVIYGYELESKTSTKILSWLDCDIDCYSVRDSKVLEDGNVLAILNNWEEGDDLGIELVTLVKTPASKVPQKNIITLATLYTDYQIRSQILKFNKTNPDYRIQVNDYSQYNTEDDYTAGFTKLNTEIISGNVPDLIQVGSQIPYKQYEAKGLLEDIYPYIDEDSDYDRDSFVQSVLKAYETDGKLYELFPTFNISTIEGRSSVVGDEMGWTMQEMQDIITANPQADAPFGLYMTRENILQGLCMLNMENFMDWSTGECSFDSPDFIGILEFAKSFPDKIADNAWENYVSDSELIAQGRQLFRFFDLYGVSSDLQRQKITFGGDVTFKGFPSSDGNGNVLMPDNGIAMTTSCKYKDGAWEFIRALLSEEYLEDAWSLPILQKSFDNKIQEAMKQEYETDENGEKVPIPVEYSWSENGEETEIYALTQEEADQIIALVDSVTRTAEYNEELNAIINDEAKAYFAGEKTVEEVASIIDSRMDIYVNESR